MAYKYSYTLTKTDSASEIQGGEDNGILFNEYYMRGKIVAFDEKADSSNPLILHQSLTFDSEGSKKEFISTLQSRLGVGKLIGSKVGFSNEKGEEV